MNFKILFLVFSSFSGFVISDSRQPTLRRKLHNQKKPKDRKQNFDIQNFEIQTFRNERMRFQDFRPKIVDTSLCFRRCFIDLSFSEFLFKTLCFSWHATCSKVRIWDFRRKIVDASLRFRRCFSHFVFLEFVNTRCF